MTPCPTCNGHNPTCPSCCGTGYKIIETLPPGDNWATTYPERLAVLRRAVVDRMTDPKRPLSIGEWETLESVVANSEEMLAEWDRRAEMIRVLVLHLSGRLADLSVLRLAVRAHQRTVEGEGMVRSEDVALWTLAGIDDDDEGDEA